MSDSDFMQPVYNVAFFVSPHGFGHAARATGIMVALSDILPSISFEIFTTVPEWFFKTGLPFSFNYHQVMTDVGLVQLSPFQEDLSATLEQLDHFLPFDTTTISDLASTVIQKKCSLIVCDISPLGIAVGQKAGVPSILVENFTWDWLYQEYSALHTGFDKHIKYLEEMFRSADYYIQAQPVCKQKKADLITQPMSRKPLVSPQKIRNALKIPQGQMMFLVTMGGIPDQTNTYASLLQQQDLCFVISGSNEGIEIRHNIVRLPYDSGFYHPDLVHACDGVIAKLGYSTLAEVFHAGVPYGYIPRSNFRETEKLEVFIKENMNGLCISEEAYRDGTWTSTLPELVKFPQIKRNCYNGTDQAASFLEELLH